MTKTARKQNLKLQQVLLDLISSYQKLSAGEFTVKKLDDLIVNYDLKIQNLLEKEAV